MSRPRFVRIVAGDIVPGMRVARSRTHEFHLITSVSHGPVSVWLGGTGFGHRPRKTAKWWRLVEPAGVC